MPWWPENSGIVSAEAMARTYRRDARGRFAGGGFSGQSGGRGARLKGGGKTRDGGGAKMKGARTGGTVAKSRSLKPQKNIRKELAYSRARAVNRKMSGKLDTAVVNIPMSGSRGRRLDAEIARNVKAQKSAARAADKARNSRLKSDQSRAKKLRDVHVGSIAKAKGISRGQVERALKLQPASTQIKALKNWVKSNRSTAAQGTRRSR